MGIFDIVERLGAIADNPNLGKAAEAIGETAVALPSLLTSIDANLERLVAIGERLENAIAAGNATLVEISLGLDAMADPIKRPPFHVADVEAAMRGEWPPNKSIVHERVYNPNVKGETDGE